MGNTNTQIFESEARFDSIKHLIGQNTQPCGRVLNGPPRKHSDHLMQMVIKLMETSIYTDCNIFTCYYDYVSAKLHTWDPSESSLHPEAEKRIGSDIDKALKIFENVITNSVTRMFIRVTELIRHGCDVYVELSEPGTRRGVTDVGKMKLFVAKSTERATTIFRLTSLMKYAKLHKFTDTSNENVNGVSIIHVQFPQNNDDMFKFNDDLLGTVKSFDISNNDDVEAFMYPNAFGKDCAINE